MKNLVLLAMAAVIGVFSFNAEAASIKKPTSSVPTATLSEIPQNDKPMVITSYSVVGTAGNLQFRQGAGVLEITFPVSPDQIRANGGKLGAMKMFVSHAVLENGVWVLKGRQKYEDHMVENTIDATTSIKAVIHLTEDMKRSGHVWLRLWGHNRSGHFLWIERDTPYTRLGKKTVKDPEGEPGYEVYFECDVQGNIKKVGPVQSAQSRL